MSNSKLIRWFKKQMSFEETREAIQVYRHHRKVLVVLAVPDNEEEEGKGEEQARDPMKVDTYLFNATEHDWITDDIRTYIYYLGSYPNEFRRGFVATDDIDAWIDHHCEKFVPSEELMQVIDEINLNNDLEVSLTSPETL